MISEIIELETDQDFFGTNPYCYRRCHFLKSLDQYVFFFLHSLSTDSMSESI